MAGDSICMLSFSSKPALVTTWSMKSHDIGNELFVGADFLKWPASFFLHAGPFYHE
jgi:hypothetical protein